MKLPAIITTDLHLTAKPRDGYRWELFHWLQGEIHKHKAKSVLILGDITDAKDFHSAELVNRIVWNIVKLTEEVEEVVILMGNHDYLGDVPFFHFLSNLPRVRFISSIYDDRVDTSASLGCLYLPHTRTPKKDWERIDMEDYDFVFMHQTVTGAIASNGQSMQGELAGDMLGPQIQIYSGDIHVPQDIGNVRYVGSPYHVHFGDAFDPRVLMIDKHGREKTLRFESIQRMTIKGDQIEVMEALMSLSEFDQVKIKLDLAPEDRARWDSIKREVAGLCSDRGIELHGIELVPRISRKILLPQARRIAAQTDHAESVTRFVVREDLGGDVLETGLDLVKK